ncbi:MAG: helix-turn-helix transcriptional regulator [SAR324 cluster bacterium]|nr:helix-turn-helix transcriptional regulator [SAR324 cluster bacterium]MBF0353426.1 helix-turn-helix transcriptional regulator [SAR324 cluster bacterium]
MTFEKRFQQIIQSCADGNKSDFARKTGKTPGQITDICKGRSKPTYDYLLFLTETYGVNIQWLLSEHGKMFMDSKASEEADDFVFVPRYNVKASAGYGSVINSEHIVDYLAFKRGWIQSDLRVDPMGLALLTVQGDSMEPTIREGDLLLVDLHQNQVLRDGIYVVRMDDVLMAKRVQRGHNGQVHIISDNRAYKEFIIAKHETEAFQILGRVIWFGRQV